MVEPLYMKDALKPEGLVVAVADFGVPSYVCARLPRVRVAEAGVIVMVAVSELGR